MHDIIEEILHPSDATNNTGVSDEFLKCYNNMNDPNYIMTTGAMIKFNNPLTKKRDGTNKDQNFFLILTMEFSISFIMMVPHFVTCGSNNRKIEKILSTSKLKE